MDKKNVIQNYRSPFERGLITFRQKFEYFHGNVSAIGIVQDT